MRVSAVVLGIAGCGCLAACGAGGDPDRLIADAARGQPRAIEGRLSAVGWGLWENSLRSERRTPAALLEAAARLQRRADQRPDDARVTIAHARARLLIGDTDVAIGILETAAAGGGDWALLNDLAVSTLTRAVERGRWHDLPRAIDLIEQAIDIDASRPQLWFNRALLLERLGPASLGITAWRDYLRRDDSSDWADEARNRLALAEPSTGTAAVTGEALREAFETAIGRWATPLGAGDAEASGAALDLARETAAAWLAHTGDRFGADLVSGIDTASPSDRQQVARAVALALEARRLILDNGVIEASRDLLLDALGRLRDRSTAWQHFLQYWLLHADWYRVDTSRLETSFEALASRAAAAGHRFLAASATVFSGSVHQRLAHYSEATEQYRTGVAMYAGLDEPDAEAGTRMLLSAALRQHGLFAEAWQQERAALERFDDIDSGVIRHNVLREAVRLMLARRQPWAAALYIRLLESEVADWNDAATSLQVALYATRAALQQQRPELAEVSLGEAERHFARVDERFAESYRLELDTIASEVLVGAAPSAAAERIGRVLDRASSSGSLFRLAQSYLQLGRARKASGDRAGALDAWVAGMGVLEAETADIRDEPTRLSRTDEVWDLYAEAMAAFVDEGRFDHAFDIAERGRARALFDVVARPMAREPPGSIEASTVQLGLYYASLPDRLCIWVIRDGAWEFRQAAVSATDLDGIVGELHDRIGRGEGADAPLRALAGYLVEPVADLLPAGEPLVIFPDGVLAGVPFAALPLPSTSPMIEAHQLTIAPSLALFARMTDAVRTAGAGVDVLVVGNPAHDSGPGAALPSLPGALREADGIGRLAPGTRQLTGEDATAVRFLDQVRGRDVVHFAGHAVTDPEYPAQSFLALAGAGDEARLTSAEIDSGAFGGVRLVVLSGCSTAVGSVSRGEGLLSLARPFHAAGVPQVVGTLWPIRDGDGEALIDFHRRMRAGEPPAAALRSVQLDLLRRGKSLRAWAGFVLSGAVTGPGM